MDIKLSGGVAAQTSTDTIVEIKEGVELQESLTQVRLNAAFGVHKKSRQFIEVTGGLGFNNNSGRFEGQNYQWNQNGSFLQAGYGFESKPTTIDSIQVYGSLVPNLRLSDYEEMLKSDSEILNSEKHKALNVGLDTHVTLDFKGLLFDVAVGGGIPFKTFGENDSKNPFYLEAGAQVGFDFE